MRSDDIAKKLGLSNGGTYRINPDSGEVEDLTVFGWASTGKRIDPKSGQIEEAGLLGWVGGGGRIDPSTGEFIEYSGFNERSTGQYIDLSTGEIEESDGFFKRSTGKRFNPSTGCYEDLTVFGWHSSTYYDSTKSTINRTSPDSFDSSLSGSYGYSSSDNGSSSSDDFWGGCLGIIFGLAFMVFLFQGCVAWWEQGGPFNSGLETRQSSEFSENSNIAQNYPAWNFPKLECGDYNPSGIQNFYAVYVNRTDESTLSYIKSNYCSDAYLMTRKSVNKRAIQVASFSSKEKAFEFSRIMLGDTTINSAEVGLPSPR